MKNKILKSHKNRIITFLISLLILTGVIVITQLNPEAVPVVRRILRFIYVYVIYMSPGLIAYYMIRLTLVGAFLGSLILSQPVIERFTVYPQSYTVKFEHTDVKKVIDKLPEVNIYRLIALLLLISLSVQFFLPAYSYAQSPTGSGEDSSENEVIYSIPNPAAYPSSDSTDNGAAISPVPTFFSSDSQTSAQLNAGSVIRALYKRSFRANERVNVVVDNAKDLTIDAEVFYSDGEEVDFDFYTQDEGERKTVVIKPPVHFKPGKYSVKVTTSDGKSYTQDFTWGVLAINTNKSIYTPNEKAKISMAVLDELGQVVCNAKVDLEITSPDARVTSFSTDDGSITVNPECFQFEVTINPDYESTYTVAGVGKYNVRLTGETDNGTYTITDEFEVKKSVPFDIERITSTRIFPPNSYPVDLSITANEDFEGTIVEVVPGNFAINDSSFSDYQYRELKSASETSLDVLGAGTSTLGLPHDGFFPISQEFSEHLHDTYEKDLYARFNLLGHDGVDFALPTGTPVIAVDDGRVVLAGYGAYGITVVIEHSWGKSYYGHLSKTKAALGANVKRGDVIGLSGSTGLSTGPHLHFGVKPNNPKMDNGYYGKIDPLPLLGIQSTLDPANQLKLILWDVSVKKGQKFVLSYFFKAPNISPEFYKLGPLKFYEKGSTINDEAIFQEARQWQIAADADGSGANTVSPTSGTTSSTGNTYVFTFDPSETMDSGGITITEPTANDWTVPQGSAGSAGYTTAVGAGSATVGDVLNNADVEDPTSPAGIWKEVDPDMCGSTSQDAAGDIVVDTTTKQEGTGSIMCEDTNGQPDNNDAWGFIYDADQNWSTFCNGGACTQISWWQRAAVNTEAFEFDVNDTSDIAGTPLVACVGSVTSANTWEYITCDLTGATLTTVRSFGFSCTSNTCNPFETDRFWVDELLIGPGVPTFSGTSPWVITVRFLDLAATDTVTVTYGSGGGSSGVTNSASEAVHTFTTASKTLVTGSYTNISSSPTVTLSSGPTLDQLLRHGKWFNGGAEQPFTF